VPTSVPFSRVLNRRLGEFPAAGFPASRTRFSKLSFDELGVLHPRDCQTSGSCSVSPAGVVRSCDAPMDSRGDNALSFCNSGPVSRGHRHGSLMHALSGTVSDANLRSERETGGLLPGKQGRPNHDWPAGLYVASPDACEGDATDWVAAAFYVTVVSCYTETREPSPHLTVSARVARHAATLAASLKTSAFLNREADIQELLRMNDDAPCERIFQFRPFGLTSSVPTEESHLPFFNSSRGNAANTPP
jgi:hypothetical protein